MAESVISLTYGAALFEAAKDTGKEEVFLRELEILDEILKETPEAGEFLNSPAIMASDKKKIIESISNVSRCSSYDSGSSTGSSQRVHCR